MAKGWMILIVILLFIVGLGIVMYSMFATVRILPKLSDTTGDMESFHFVNTVFEIDRVYYHSGITENNTIENICESGKYQIVIVEGLFKIDKLPEHCELLCDNRFQKQFIVEVPDCLDCERQMRMLIDLKRQDTTIDHTITMCCDGACDEKRLLAEC